MPRAESSMTIPVDWQYKPIRPKLGSRAEVASAFWLFRAIVRSSEPEENTYYKREDYQRPHGCQGDVYGTSPPHDDVLWPRISHR